MSVLQILIKCLGLLPDGKDVLDVLNLSAVELCVGDGGKGAIGEVLTVYVLDELHSIFLQTFIYLFIFLFQCSS